MRRRVLLKKLLSKALRTEIVTGIAPDLPTPGIPFMMVADPLSAEASFRLIATSAVRGVKCDGSVFEFTTVSGSQYSLTVLSEDSGPTAIDLLAPTAQA